MDHTFDHLAGAAPRGFGLAGQAPAAPAWPRPTPAATPPAPPAPVATVDLPARAQLPAVQAPGRRSLAVPTFAWITAKFPHLVRNKPKVASAVHPMPAAAPSRAPADPDAELRGGSRLVLAARARERRRCETILKAGAHCPALARRLAFETRSPTSEALALLADQPGAREAENRQGKAEQRASGSMDRAFKRAAAFR